MRVSRTATETIIILGAALCSALIGAFAKADPGLQDLFLQFQSVESIKFTATVEFRNVQPITPECVCLALNAPPGTTVTGYFEYSGQGDRYRVNSYLDPEKFEGMQTQVAYDGVRFQLLLSDGTLSLSSQDSPTILPILLNPLLQLLQFRYPMTDDNYQYEIRLANVLNDSPPPEFFESTRGGVPGGSRTLRRATFPGGTYDGVAYEHRVYANASSLDKPIAIDRARVGGAITPDGSDAITSTEFSDYVQIDTATAPAFWPLTIVMHAYNSDGEEVASVSYKLTELLIDEELTSSDFLIDSGAAERVWDDDLGQFIAP
jgi:hypothetical protein